MPEPAAAQDALSAASRNKTANRGGEALRRPVEPIKRTDALEDPAADRLSRHRRDRCCPITNDGATTVGFPQVSGGRKLARLQHAL